MLYPTFAADHHVIELHAVRAFEVFWGLRCLFKQLRTHVREREIVVTTHRDGVVALRNRIAL